MREPNTRKSRVKKEQENLTPFVDVNGLDCEYKPMNLAAKEQVGLKTVRKISIMFPLSYFFCQTEMKIGMSKMGMNGHIWLVRNELN
jgi:hypothetical protein